MFYREPENCRVAVLALENSLESTQRTVPHLLLPEIFLLGRQSPVMEFQDRTREVAMQANIDEALGTVQLPTHSPGEKQFAPAADTIVAANHKVPASIPVVIELVAAVLLPGHQIAGNIIAGESNPCFQKLRPC